MELPTSFEKDIMTLGSKINELLKMVSKSAYDSGKLHQYDYMIGRDIIMKEFNDTHLHKMLAKKPGDWL
jgi:hypothetical protein